MLLAGGQVSRLVIVQIRVVYGCWDQFRPRALVKQPAKVNGVLFLFGQAVTSFLLSAVGFAGKLQLASKMEGANKSTSWGAEKRKPLLLCAYVTFIDTGEMRAKSREEKRCKLL